MLKNAAKLLSVLMMLSHLLPAKAISDKQFLACEKVSIQYQTLNLKLLKEQSSINPKTQQIEKYRKGLTSLEKYNNRFCS